MQEKRNEGGSNETGKAHEILGVIFGMHFRIT
jgi:hypothetical protein